ncbi:hypothetical protein CDQ92_11265 [Sphingopyxis bauzanensis]|uniref:HTH marR-type domain-containing protein n=2 Tax=Sphingopyxis bauzanensis TaxID=651663 RepID=A0A246JYU3_9SPHN|nr:hypothetical protein CDQ92_11265 [Sphingopyxis bauzanensis]
MEEEDLAGKRRQRGDGGRQLHGIDAVKSGHTGSGAQPAAQPDAVAVDPLPRRIVDADTGVVLPVAPRRGDEIRGGLGAAPFLEKVLQAEGERMAAAAAANPAEERVVSGQPADNLEEECARDRDVHGAVLSGGRDAGGHRQRVPLRSPPPLLDRSAARGGKPPSARHRSVRTTFLDQICRASSGNSDAFWSAADRPKPIDFWRGSSDGCEGWRSLVRAIVLPPRAIGPWGMDTGGMKPAGARQFETARTHPCIEASETKAFAKALLAANRARDGILSDVGFADATWMLLLDLFVSQAHDGRLSLSDLYTSIDAPKATTLRTIGRLVDQGHLQTEADPRDGRRTLVRLTEETYRQMSEVVEEIRGIIANARSEV